MYLAGVAAASPTPGRAPARVLVDGYAYGSSSMTCFRVDAPAIETDETNT